MKLHNKSSLLGVYAALELASDRGRQFTAAEIAEKYRVSQHHLAKVMRNLVKGGLATAVRGVGGGYRFSGDADQVTLLTVVELFEEVASNPETLGEPLDEGNPVIMGMQKLSAEMEDLARTVLGSVSLNKVLNGAQEGFILRAQDADLQLSIIGPPDSVAEAFS